MMTPATDYPVPSDGTMTQQFYNNVVVSSPHPRNTTEVFTFFADGAGLPTGKMKLDAEWNTFWIRGQSWIGNSYSLFQVSNYIDGPNRVGEIALHFSNNIVHFAGRSLWHTYKAQLFTIMGGSSWSITGSNNWFDDFMANACSSIVRANGGIVPAFKFGDS